jgi:hypothetical protein
MIVWNSGESCIQDVTSPKQRCLVKGFNKDRHPPTLVDSAPGHHLKLKNPCVRAGVFAFLVL